MNVLVVAAHPDDEIIGVGGTIAKHTDNGDIVNILIVAEGKSSRESSYKSLDIDIKKLSHDETDEACEVLGVHKVYREDYPDNRLDSLPLLEVTKLIEKYIKLTSPDIVYTHFHGDINNDHTVLFKAVMTATRPLPGNKVKKVLAFETLSSTEWNYQNNESFRPNYFEVIEEQLDRKLLAMSKYSSELRNFPHPRSLDSIKINANLWGSKVGHKAVEPFIMVRSIR